MPATRLRLATLSLSLALSGCGESAPPTPIVELHSTADTIATGLAETPSAAWLGGSRWAVVAPLDVTVALLDFTSHRSTPLGKTGEIKNPAQVFALGDTLYVGDWGLRRTSVWTLEGHLVRSIPAAAVARGALPEGRDRTGRFYLELAPPPGPDGSGNRDSAAVVASDARITRIDTLARLAPLDLAEVMGDAGRRFERRVFSGTDHWGALADGSLWVARVYHNRVDVRGPEGRWTEGQALPDRVLEVTRYDREVFLRKFPPELRATAEQLPFAPVKPPFEAAFSDPGGSIWLEKSRAPVDSSRRYHVVDRRGRLLREVRVPGPGRILAVGDQTALVAERVQHGTRFVLFRLTADQAAP
ncbi:MAG TPA: hypothetical protein VJQ44_01295 [Gemmatimonadales bacterium]|nr:hypothetical protein [Gemmatimonadales bacterium]